MPRSAIEPHRHPGLEGGGIAERIEAQAQRVAVVIADGALGLPGRERPERHQLGDECGRKSTLVRDMWPQLSHHQRFQLSEGDTYSAATAP